MSFLLDLIFPRLCYGCGKTGCYFCPDCVQKLTPQPALYDSKLPFEGQIYLFKYHSLLKSAIVDLKYHFVTDLALELSSLISNTLLANYPHVVSYWQQYHYHLVPIPLHDYRFNWRGFNQSELLSSLIAKNLNLPFSPRCLTRSRFTSSQVQLQNPSLRHQNLQDAFLLNKPISSAILFDDVFTTGATLKSAASVFPKGSSIWTLTLASH